MASSDGGQAGNPTGGPPSGPKKRLEAVGTVVDATEGRAGRDEAEPVERGRRGLPGWLFLVVFVLFSLALVWQVREARRLESVVATLEGDLAEARILLGAHRDHLGEIRVGVEGLSERLGELRRLVETGPAMRPDAGGAGAPIGAGSGSDPGDDDTSGSPSIPARLPES